MTVPPLGAVWNAIVAPVSPISRGSARFGLSGRRVIGLGPRGRSHPQATKLPSSVMFDALTDKFSTVFRSLAGRGKISEENIRESMREVRTALLEADVNFQVVKEFTDRVVQKAIGQHVINSLQPGQLMVKIVYDELLELLGPVDTRIYFVQPGPTIIMMCGLQGSGKTTTCGKLAMYLKSKGHHPLLAAVDLQRPAAVEQLRVIAGQVDVPVYADDSKVAPHGQVARGSATSVARASIQEAKK